MNYQFINTDGEDISCSSIDCIQEVISKPYEHWLSGTGDCAIQVKPEKRLIFFKLQQGVFISSTLITWLR